MKRMVGLKSTRDPRAAEGSETQSSFIKRQNYVADAKQTSHS